jgi:hypothetical protein
MQFDVVATNPPFQDSTKKKKTQHKLWIDFTQRAFDKWLKPGGLLLQVSPSSFMSPSNKILKIFQDKMALFLHLDTKKYFPDVGSTFADYAIVNTSSVFQQTEITTSGGTFSKEINALMLYLPNDFCEEAYSIHQKVIFNQKRKLDVRYDYVTCHNVLIHRNDTISKTKTPDHIFPIFHTNSQVWYSKIRQDWGGKKKVMWSRSGYTKPFYDDGVYGGTDMAYYVLVPDAESGENLVSNLNTKLIKYILKTAKWSGFGNEKVFRSLPDLAIDRKLSDLEIYVLFGLTEEERDYVENHMG